MIGSSPIWPSKRERTSNFGPRIACFFLSGPALAQVLLFSLLEFWGCLAMKTKDTGNLEYSPRFCHHESTPDNHFPSKAVYDDMQIQFTHTSANSRGI